MRAFRLASFDFRISSKSEKYIDCSQNGQISSLSVAKTYRVAKQHIDIQKVGIILHSAQGIRLGAYALRSIAIEPPRSNLHSLACASTDLLRLIFEFERSENISSCEATYRHTKSRNYTPCEPTAVAVTLRASSSCDEGSRSTRSTIWK